MALTPFLKKTGISPAFLAVSGDITGGKISGVSVVGELIYLTDLKTWKICTVGDGTVVDFALPFEAEITSTIDIGKVDQGSPASSNPWLTTDSGDVSLASTTAPSVATVVGGKSNDATAQYGNPLAQGAAGRSLIIEGYEGGTPQPVVGKANVVGVTFTHSTDTTQYTAKDGLARTVTISGATTATPIVVAATAHGLVDTDVVTISGITGLNANGTFYIKKTTVGDADHFGLYSDKALLVPIVGSGAGYGGSPVCVPLFRIPSIFRVVSGTGYITKIRVGVDSATWTDQLKIHFYGSAATSSADNSAFTLLWANETVRLGVCTLPALATEGTGSDMSIASGLPGDGVSGLPLIVRNLDASQDLYFRLETLGTGTPTSGLPFYFEFTLDSN